MLLIMIKIVIVGFFLGLLFENLFFVDFIVFDNFMIVYDNFILVCCVIFELIFMFV